MRMTLREIIEMLVSNCSGPILAIASDEDRKLCARVFVCRSFMRALIAGAMLERFFRSSQISIILQSLVLIM